MRNSFGTLISQIVKACTVVRQPVLFFTLVWALSKTPAPELQGNSREHSGALFLSFFYLELRTQQTLSPGRWWCLSPDFAADWWTETCRCVLPQTHSSLIGQWLHWPCCDSRGSRNWERPWTLLYSHLQVTKKNHIINNKIWDCLGRSGTCRFINMM